MDTSDMTSDQLRVLVRTLVHRWLDYIEVVPLRAYNLIRSWAKGETTDLDDVIHQLAFWWELAGYPTSSSDKDAMIIARAARRMLTSIDAGESVKDCALVANRSHADIRSYLWQT